MSPRFPSSVIDQMLTRGQITRVAPNRAQSDQLMTQAEEHLRSAQLLRDTDTAGAFVLAYDAARKALSAVLLNQGLKSRGEGAHALLAEAVGSQLASVLDLTGFGWMRTTRNATEYGSDRHPSATAADVDEAVEMASIIHQRAGRVLDHMYPY
jgi:uncharacterized protein (UPF0332 family)